MPIQWQESPSHLPDSRLFALFMQIHLTPGYQQGHSYLFQVGLVQYGHLGT